MCALKTETGFKKLQNLLEVTTTLVELHNGGQFFRVHDNVETTDLGLGKSE